MPSSRENDVQGETVFKRLGNRTRKTFEPVFEEAFNVFITGFPTHLTVRELWRICEKHGDVVDVFIARRLSKSGKAFGFVKYIRVDHEDLIIEELCREFIGKLKIQANKARFKREERKSNEIGPGSQQGQQRQVNAFKPLPTGNSDKVCNNYTYANALKRGTFWDNDAIAGDTVKVRDILLDDSCINPKSYKFAVAGCLKEFNSLKNLHSLCEGEGFRNVTLRYLGGFWVLYQFTDETARDSFLQNKGVESWFDKFHKWNGEVKVNNRLVWLEIEGVPPLIWSKETFTRLTKQWGSLVYVEDDKDPNLYSIRLCVNTIIQPIIFESFDVSWRGNTYTVRAREVTGWLPDFVNSEEQTHPTHVADTSEEVARFDEAADRIADRETRRDNDITSVADTKLDRHSPTNSDPFKLQSLIEKVMVEEDESDAKTPTYPPGFIPQSMELEGVVEDNIHSGDGSIGGQLRNDGAIDPGGDGIETECDSGSEASGEYPFMEAIHVMDNDFDHDPIIVGTSKKGVDCEERLDISGDNRNDERDSLLGDSSRKTTRRKQRLLKMKSFVAMKCGCKNNKKGAKCFHEAYYEKNSGNVENEAFLVERVDDSSGSECYISIANSRLRSLARCPG